MKRYLLLGLHIASLVLLGFGWTLDILHISVGIEKHLPFLGDISVPVADETRSVLTTLQKLWQTANYFPFTLIALFGILIPLIKSAAIFYLLLKKNAGGFWYEFVNMISKWAMADVFAISILVAFLAASAMDATHADLRPGFYFFAGYVVLSGIVAMLLGRLIKKDADTLPKATSNQNF